MVTLDEIKAWLGITGTEDDDYLNTLNAAYTASIERYCERKFDKATYADKVIRPKNPDTILFPQYPVDDSVVTVLMDDEEVDPTYYRVESDKGVLQRTNDGISDGIRWDAAEVLELQYDGGYDPVPADLKYVILELIRSSYLNKDSDPMSGPIKFERIDGGASRSYSTKAQEEMATGATGTDPMLLQYSSTLDSYRSERTIL